MKLFDKVAIVGVGIIGGSIGMALKSRHIVNKVIGICRRRENIKQAVRLGAIDEGFLELERIKDCDLIILATPVSNIIETISKINGLVKNHAIIMDVGSAKAKIIQAAKKYLPQGISFVGAHPLAGSEKKGVEFSSDRLFENSLCILTPCADSKKADLDKIKKFWRALGASTTYLSVNRHDKIIAFTSHLPHLVAFSLIDSLPKYSQKFIANSFKDTTRIANSDFSVWQDIFITNAKEVLRAINRFQSSLNNFKQLIAKKDKDALSILIKQIQQKRCLIK